QLDPPARGAASRLQDRQAGCLVELDPGLLGLRDLRLAVDELHARVARGPADLAGAVDQPVARSLGVQLERRLASRVLAEDDPARQVATAERPRSVARAHLDWPGDELLGRGLRRARVVVRDGGGDGLDGYRERRAHRAEHGLDAATKLGL